MGQKILPDRKSSIFQETLDPKGFFICVSMGPKVLLEQILILLELKQMVTVFVHTLKLNLFNCFNTVVKLNCFNTVVKLKIEI